MINNQLANIKKVLLQVSKTHKMQVGGDIYSILENLWNIIHRDMEKQAYHIQVLMADKLDLYKGKSVEMVDENIKTLQETY